MMRRGRARPIHDYNNRHDMQFAVEMKGYTWR